ncbi:MULTISPECIES: hypothetical protein [unclassified Rhizobium]|uniref:hypothetical protein n=1 Tax=unclassified Rhizobium TaxID=2613769 RepID=UPI0016230B59|nr:MULTISPECIES: hypothetical protein [unclassified Rhizobium]MBB3297901.1 hypothetical protein [Rhizobium sp. BK112]MBB4177604.1 hypothetical protein [Rhizobium sp. BK109]
MEALEKAVRDAAETLQQAVDKAVAAGYVVVFPQAAGQPVTALSISSTAKVVEDVATAATPSEAGKKAK